MKNLYKLTKARKLEKIEDDKIIAWKEFITLGKDYDGKYEYKRKADELARI